MDTIRRKMYLLKIETSDTINRLLSVETEAARNSEAVKEREHRLRQLMKEVLKKENELDKMTSALEKTEKKISETNRCLHLAKNEKANFTEGIRLREDQIKLNEIKTGPISNTLTKESTKADEAEKVRKELEHHVNFCEEKVEKMETELMNAKKTMRETHDKYDETSKRLALKEKKLVIALASAEKSEERVKELEMSLSNIARKMANKETSREKVGKKEEHHKNQLRQIVMMDKEAEHRATQIEDEKNKLEVFVSQLEEEKKILKRMIEKKEGTLQSKTS